METEGKSHSCVFAVVLIMLSAMLAVGVLVGVINRQKSDYFTQVRCSPSQPDVCARVCISGNTNSSADACQSAIMWYGGGHVNSDGKYTPPPDPDLATYLSKRACKLGVETECKGERP